MAYEELSDRINLAAQLRAARNDGRLDEAVRKYKAEYGSESARNTDAINAIMDELIQQGEGIRDITEIEMDNLLHNIVDYNDRRYNVDPTLERIRASGLVVNDTLRGLFEDPISSEQDRTYFDVQADERITNSRSPDEREALYDAVMARLDIESPPKKGTREGVESIVQGIINADVPEEMIYAYIDSKLYLDHPAEYVARDSLGQLSSASYVPTSSTEFPPLPPLPDLPPPPPPQPPEPAPEPASSFPSVSPFASDSDDVDTEVTLSNAPDIPALDPDLIYDVIDAPRVLDTESRPDLPTDRNDNEVRATRSLASQLSDEAFENRLLDAYQEVRERLEAGVNEVADARQAAAEAEEAATEAEEAAIQAVAAIAEAGEADIGFARRAAEMAEIDAKSARESAEEAAENADDIAARVAETNSHQHVNFSENAARNALDAIMEAAQDAAAIDDPTLLRAFINEFLLQVHPDPYAPDLPNSFTGEPATVEEGPAAPYYLPKKLAAIRERAEENPVIVIDNLAGQLELEQERRRGLYVPNEVTHRAPLGGLPAEPTITEDTLEAARHMPLVPEWRLREAVSVLQDSSLSRAEKAMALGNPGATYEPISARDRPDPEPLPDAQDINDAVESFIARMARHHAQREADAARVQEVRDMVADRESAASKTQLVTETEDGPTADRGPVTSRSRADIADERIQRIVARREARIDAYDDELHEDGRTGLADRARRLARNALHKVPLLGRAVTPAYDESDPETARRAYNDDLKEVARPVAGLIPRGEADIARQDRRDEAERDAFFDQVEREENAKIAAIQDIQAREEAMIRPSRIAEIESANANLDERVEHLNDTISAIETELRDSTNLTVERQTSLNDRQAEAQQDLEALLKVQALEALTPNEAERYALLEGEIYNEAREIVERDPTVTIEQALEQIFENNGNEYQGKLGTSEEVVHYGAQLVEAEPYLADADRALKPIQIDNNENREAVPPPDPNAPLEQDSRIRVQEFEDGSMYKQVGEYIYVIADSPPNALDEEGPQANNFGFETGQLVRFKAASGRSREGFDPLDDEERALLSAGDVDERGIPVINLYAEIDYNPEAITPEQYVAEQQDDLDVFRVIQIDPETYEYDAAEGVIKAETIRGGTVTLSEMSETMVADARHTEAIDGSVCLVVLEGDTLNINGHEIETDPSAAPATSAGSGFTPPTEEELTVTRPRLVGVDGDMAASRPVGLEDGQPADNARVAELDEENIRAAQEGGHSGVNVDSVVDAGSTERTRITALGEPIPDNGQAAPAERLLVEPFETNPDGSLVARTVEVTEAEIGPRPGRT